MRRSLLLLPFAAALSAAPQPASASELIVTVSGIAADGGEIGCALHAAPDGFPMAPEKAVRQWHPAGTAGVTCRFADLAPGRYAVAVSHDLNGNRVTDTALFGIPKEPWGVTNNVRPGLRPPRFEEAAVDVPAEGSIVVTVEVAR